MARNPTAHRRRNPSSRAAASPGPLSAPDPSALAGNVAASPFVLAAASDAYVGGHAGRSTPTCGHHDACSRHASPACSDESGSNVARLIRQSGHALLRKKVAYKRSSFGKLADLDVFMDGIFEPYGVRAASPNVDASLLFLTRFGILLPLFALFYR